MNWARKKQETQCKGFWGGEGEAVLCTENSLTKSLAEA